MDPIADTMTGNLPLDATLSGSVQTADTLIGYGPFVLFETPKILFKLTRPITWIDYDCIKSDVKSYYYENFINNSADDSCHQNLTKIVTILIRKAGENKNYYVISVLNHNGAEALVKFNDFYQKHSDVYRKYDIYFPLNLQQDALNNFNNVWFGSFDTN